MRPQRTAGPLGRRSNSEAAVGVVAAAAVVVVGCSASRVLRSSRGDLQRGGFGYRQGLLFINTVYYQKSMVIVFIRTS